MAKYLERVWHFGELAREHRLLWTWKVVGVIFALFSMVDVTVTSYFFVVDKTDPAILIMAARAFERRLPSVQVLNQR